MVNLSVGLTGEREKLGEKAKVRFSNVTILKPCPDYTTARSWLQPVTWNLNCGLLTERKLAVSDYGSRTRRC